MIELVITIVVVLAGSAFCSGLEAALFAVPESRAHMYANRGVKGADALLALKHNLSPAIILIVICNNVFNIVGSILVGVFATAAFGDAAIGIISAVMTALVIMFGEIVPKTVGENNADDIALFFAAPLRIAIKIFYPLIWLVSRATELLRRQKKAIMTEEELAMLSSLSHAEGSIEEDEHEMIQRVFTLNDLTAADIMTPRNEMLAYHDTVELGHLEDKIYEMPHSRIPVYGESIDDITGIVLRNELLMALAHNRQRDLISEFKKPALFVRPTMKADELLPLFQKKQQHLAVVRGLDKVVLGVVTLEDVLEELVGEIADETDYDEMED